MKSRLKILEKLLSPDGSIYLHLDWNETHYAKVLMDEIFGRNSFQREIIWRIGWISGYKTKAKNYIRNHDTLLYYTKNPNDFIFNKVIIPYSKGYKRRDGSLPKGKGYPLEDTWNCSEIDRLDSIQIKSFSKEKTGFFTQKNENLLKRIIEASSNIGDFVLDSFAGSGTTGAVAHKMGRKWIMIEMGKHAETHIIPRMKRVISGKDSTGITKDVGFNGGGGFRYCVLGKSAIKKDEMGIIEMSVDNGELIEAICKIECFKLIEQDFFRSSKLHGVINGKRYCNVAEDFVTQDYIDDLSNEISEDESLVVYAMKNTSGLKLRANIEVKKMPRDIMKKFKIR